jgi:hypothetical protein
VTDKQRINQLEADVYTLARLLMDHQGGKQALIEILERGSANRHETRPQAGFKQRVQVNA